MKTDARLPPSKAALSSTPKRPTRHRGQEPRSLPYPSWFLRGILQARRAPVPGLGVLLVVPIGRRYVASSRIVACFRSCLANGPANAQAGATPAPSTNDEHPSAQPPTADDVCRALEAAAAENGLPFEFFARVIWQESRFDALAVSPKGAAGIAQFMPATASRHGLADPFGQKLAAAPTRFCFRAISDVARSERMTYR